LEATTEAAAARERYALRHGPRRVCKKCGEEKPILEFKPSGSRYSYECATCSRDRLWKIGRTWKQYALEKKGSKCECCGMPALIAELFEFDHRPGTVKNFDISNFCNTGYSFNEDNKRIIDTELIKCDLLCTLCHKLRTRQRKRHGLTAEEKRFETLWTSGVIGRLFDTSSQLHPVNDAV
jgi:hypothetical protein